MSLEKILGEYTPTKYVDPLTCGRKPHKLSEREIQEVIEVCFTKRSQKLPRLFKLVADTTAAGVGIKTHETRNLKYQCTYNNPACRIKVINEKLRHNGFKFYIWAAHPANKRPFDDSWLLWLVVDDEGVK